MSDRAQLEIMWTEKDNRPKLEPVLFDSQDDIDRQREQLIADIEGKLQQRVSQTLLFAIRWTLG